MAVSPRPLLREGRERHFCLNSSQATLQQQIPRALISLPANCYDLESFSGDKSKICPKLSAGNFVACKSFLRIRYLFAFAEHDNCPLLENMLSDYEMRLQSVVMLASKCRCLVLTTIYLHGASGAKLFNIVMQIYYESHIMKYRVMQNIFLRFSPFNLAKRRRVRGQFLIPVQPPYLSMHFRQSS